MEKNKLEEKIKAKKGDFMYENLGGKAQDEIQLRILENGTSGSFTVVGATGTTAIGLAIAGKNKKQEDDKFKS